MTTTTSTNWNGLTRNTISLNVFDELDGVASEVKLLDSYEHPQHPGSADWTIYLYEYTYAETGLVSHVIATNGGAEWEEAADGYHDLLEEYAIGI